MSYEEVIVEENERREVVNEYQKGPGLGSGGFAKCYEVTHLQSRKKFAIKIVSKEEISDEKSKQKLLLEIKIHKALSHKNVVRFDHVFEDRENVYIVMELCRNQTLKELQKRRSRLTEFELRSYLLQIVHGVTYLHENLIIHRDLKLGNIFVNHKMELKIGDFGLSTKLRFREERRHTVCGTPNYIAPEILLEQGHSFEADIFSIGVILYTLMFGKPPFEADTVEDTYANIKANRYSFPKHATATASPEVKDLIHKMLLPQPSQRLNISQILAHPFLLTSYEIPSLLPTYTLTVPPLASYVKQFVPQGFAIKLTEKPKRLSKDRQEPERRLQKCRSVEGHLGDLPLDFEPEPSNNPNNNAVIIKCEQQAKKEQILKRIKSMSSLSPRASLPEQPTEVIEVSKFSDCSKKYGYGYILSTGCLGVHFNDKSNLLQDCSRRLWYAEYNAPLCQAAADDSLRKKLEILDIFRSHFGNREKGVGQARGTGREPVFVLKVVKRANYYILKLSNKLLVFRWETDFVAFRDYKYVKYRVGGKEGEGLVGLQYSARVEERLEKVRAFLRESTTAHK